MSLTLTLKHTKFQKKIILKKYIDDIIEFMFEKEIQSVIVEGGKKTL